MCRHKAGKMGLSSVRVVAWQLFATKVLLTLLLMVEILHYLKDPPPPNSGNSGIFPIIGKP